MQVYLRRIEQVGESLIPDLIKLGLDRETIDEWLSSSNPDAMLDFHYDFDIAFDVDEWESNNKDDLPSELTLSIYDFNYVDGETDIDELNDAIGDYLSDEYGYCHKGFQFDVEGEKIYVYDIDWDLSESLKEGFDDIIEDNIDYVPDYVQEDIDKVKALKIGQEVKLRISGVKALVIKRESDSRYNLYYLTKGNGKHDYMTGSWRDVVYAIFNANSLKLPPKEIYDKLLNESSQSQSKGLTEGDTFEYGGLSFTLWYLDGEDEFAIVCDDVEENYDNTPAAIGFVEKTANKNDVMGVIKSYFNVFMSTIGNGLHYSEHYLDNLGIKSSDEIVGKLRYAVEIQPETEMDEFENYEDALDYFNEMVDFYKNTEHASDDELSVALQIIDDETLYDTIKFWRKNSPEDEVLSESGNTTASEDVDLSKFTNTNTNKEPLKQATFVIEDGPRYIGYDEEYSWNGWACPWFTKEEGLKIADNLYGYLTFDEAKDSFVMVNQDTTDSEYDYYVGDDIETVDGIQHLYPIGNKSWIWDIVSNYDDVDDDMGDFYAVQN